MVVMLPRATAQNRCGMGEQLGSQIAVKAKPEYLRLILATVVLLVAFRMFLGLFYQPDEIYTVYPL